MDGEMSERLFPQVRLRSWAADDLIAYCDALSHQLSENPLLTRFGRGNAFDRPDEPIRLPLKAVPYDEHAEQREVVARERLRFSMIRSADDASHDYEDGRRSAADRAKPPTPPRPLDGLVDACDRAVILGDPGSGKTEALKRYARDAALVARRQLFSSDTPIEVVCLPIYITFPRLAAMFDLVEDQKGSYVDLIKRLKAAFKSRKGDIHVHKLPAAILLAVQEHVPAATGPRVEAQLWAALAQYETPGIGQAAPLICLDGWDEAAAKDQNDISDSLRVFAERSGARIVMGSRVVGYYRKSNPLFDATKKNDGHREIRLCPFDPADVFLFVERFFANQPEVAQKLVNELRLKPNAAEAARNPLLATLLCVAYLPEPEKWQTQPLSLPMCRGQLYERVLERLVEEWPDHRVGRKVAKSPRPWRTWKERIDDKLDLLSAIAFRFFPREVIGGRELDNLLAGNLPQEHLRQGNRYKKVLLKNGEEALLEDLSEDGILTPVGDVGEDSFAFLHRTFQEYLVARWLAARGWKRIAEFVDQACWLPAWQEVIILLAGCLEDPGPLIDLLADKSKDDVASHRLGLLCMAAAEIPAGRQMPEKLLNLANWVTESVSQGRIDFPPPLMSGLPSLFRRLPKMADALATKIQDVDTPPRVSSDIIRAVGRIGSVFAENDALVQTLTGAINNSAKHHGASTLVQELIAAFRQPLGTNEKFISSLARLIHEDDDEVQYSALHAIETLGCACGQKEVIIQSLALLLNAMPISTEIQTKLFETIHSVVHLTTNNRRFIQAYSDALRCYTDDFKKEVRSVKAASSKYNFRGAGFGFKILPRILVDATLVEDVVMILQDHSLPRRFREEAVIAARHLDTAIIKNAVVSVGIANAIAALLHVEDFFERSYIEIIKTIEVLTPIIADQYILVQALLEYISDYRRSQITRIRAIFAVKAIGPALTDNKQIVQSLLTVRQSSMRSFGIRAAIEAAIRVIDPGINQTDELVWDLCMALKSGTDSDSGNVCMGIRYAGPELILNENITRGLANALDENLLSEGDVLDVIEAIREIKPIFSENSILIQSLLRFYDNKLTHDYIKPYALSVICGILSPLGDTIIWSFAKIIVDHEISDSMQSAIKEVIWHNKSEFIEKKYFVSNLIMTLSDHAVADRTRKLAADILLGLGVDISPSPEVFAWLQAYILGQGVRKLKMHDDSVVGFLRLCDPPHSEPSQPVIKALLRDHWIGIGSYADFPMHENKQSVFCGDKRWHERDGGNRYVACPLDFYHQELTGFRAKLIRPTV